MWIATWVRGPENGLLTIQIRLGIQEDAAEFVASSAAPTRTCTDPSIPTAPGNGSTDELNSPRLPDSLLPSPPGSAGLRAEGFVLGSHESDCRHSGPLPASTRFPGKPSIPSPDAHSCNGWWNAVVSRSLRDVVVATDDPRVAEVARTFARVEMTVGPPAVRTGSPKSPPPGCRRTATSTFKGTNP